MIQLELLWRLQCIDREIFSINKILKNRELYDRLKMIKDSYMDIKKNVDAETAEYEKCCGDIEKLNCELKQLDIKLKEDNRRLYQDGQNMKAIDNIQKEIQSYHNKIDHTENQLFRMMESSEKLNKNITEEKDKLSALRDEMEKLKNKYIEDSEQCNKKLQELNEKREDLKKEIDTSLMRRYDSIAAKKGIAVAQVKDGACTQCGVKLNAMLYDMLKKSGRICLCDYCGRILYIE